MESNIYRAPEAELQHEDVAGQEFYVVAKRKFLILTIATFGLYEIYWFYKNWSYYRLVHGEKMWPVMRAIFSIFFAHALFRAVDARLQQSQHNYKWSPGLMATIYVIVSIVSSVADSISSKTTEFSILDVISTLIFPLVVWVLYRAQMAINIACDDPLGERNSELTPANFLWVAIGVLIWGLLAIGFYEIFVGLPE